MWDDLQPVPALSHVPEELGRGQGRDGEEGRLEVGVHQLKPVQVVQTVPLVAEVVQVEHDGSLHEPSWGEAHLHRHLPLT